MFAVLTRIGNEQSLLRPGMNADVEIVIGRRDEALSLENGAIKTPEDARQLVQALGLDPELLKQRAEAPAESDASDDEAGGEEGEGEVLDQLRSMSQEERRRHLQQLEPAERQRILQGFRQARERQQQADRTNPARPKPAFVFVEDSTGVLTIRPVTIGLSSWEFTEVLAGLEEGDEVLQVPLALIQQLELLERVRSRTGLPGVQRR